MRVLAINVLVLSCCVWALEAPHSKITVKQIDYETVRIDYKISNHKELHSVKLYRSYFDIADMQGIDLFNSPISVYDLPAEAFQGIFIDTNNANGATYYYYVSAIPVGTDTPYVCNIQRTRCGEKSLLVAAPKSCYFLIDKRNYVLELWSNGSTLKKYAICLGRNPMKRKICSDNLSTPEGKYRIASINLQSKYHKSFMLNYPNEVDKARYQAAIASGEIPRSNGITAGIGGDIAIHGGGVGNNWTFGCIALENEDIDELLSLDCVRVGTMVYIVGEEVTRDDIQF